MDRKTKDQMIADMIPIIDRIAVIQKERGLTDSKLCDEFPQLGSPKTWKDRLLAHNWAELKIELWHRKLASVGVILDGGVPDEDFHLDLPFAKEMLGRLGKLERQTNDRRILTCLAANGCGKSLFTRWAVAQSRSTRAVVRIRPSWRNKIIHICRGIAGAMGKVIQTTNAAEAEDECIQLLKGNPRTLFIDQAHEGGVAVMHLLRAFVDETPSRFVYLAYNTAYRHVLSATNDAAIESQAWLGRCIKPVFDLYSAGTRAEDVAFYLETYADLSADAAKSLAARLVAALNWHTNLRLLDDAIESARIASRNDTLASEAIRAKVYELSGQDPKIVERKAAE